ncbi:conserved hypothetical protein [Candida albicans WO-1]|uniref:Uncharacterized protein n=1 Tax=Candida albicans (strain WO-1) TaxID=294748 RepID=C4YRC8_CANAW|nr:conserved hypothetical protein [Candida albicans WO-1]
MSDNSNSSGGSTIPSLCYVIPPYLLNSNYGSNLQKQLLAKNQQMGLLNVISTDSKNYYNHFKEQQQDQGEGNNKRKRKFTKDPYLNEIIKMKLIYKLSILGVLGDNPMEFLNGNDNDDYIYDMFDTFKRRLISSDDNDDDNGDSNSRDESKIGDGSDSGDVQLMLVDALRRNNKDDSNNYKLPKSVFSNGNNKIGEVEFNQLSGIPSQYKKYLSMSLKDLILSTNCHINDRYNYPPSFIDFGNDEFFNYTLPITWIPLIPNRYLSHLEKHYNLVIQDDQGFSNIKMSIDTSPNSASSSGAKNGDGSNLYQHDESHDDIAIDIDDEISRKQRQSRYYNLITDKAIISSVGIFYYEVEIEQVVTESTNFNSIIQMNDSSINSNNSMMLSLGFIKRLINFEPSPTTSPNSLHNHHHHDSNSGSNNNGNGNNNTGSILAGRVDLENIKSDLFANDSLEEEESIGDIETKKYLTARPGELRGSVAINLEDSTLYNSINSISGEFGASSASASSSMHRAQILNMNRRLSNRSEYDSTATTTAGGGGVAGKINIDIPLKTKLVKDCRDERVYKTDIIGMGVNFIDKSIFITLNGVLARVITDTELNGNSDGDKTSNNNNNNNSNNSNDNNNKTSTTDYGKIDEEAMYPMIGFRINEINRSLNNVSDQKTNDKAKTTKVNIKTNFGSKSFFYDIDSYVAHYKNLTRQLLNMKILEMINLDVKEYNAAQQEIDKSNVFEIIKNYMMSNGGVNNHNNNNIFANLQRNLLELNEKDNKDHLFTLINLENDFM